MKTIAFVSLLFVIVFIFGQITFAQSGRAKPSKEQTVRPTPTPKYDTEKKLMNPNQTLPQDANQPGIVDDEVLRVETNLVTVPVSVMDKDGKYIPNLRKEDFHLFENDVEQDIAFFASVEAPFTVALVLDMSDSTTAFRRDIQDAANAFVRQLRKNDRAMVVAFTEEIRFLSKPTSDSDELRAAIFDTNFLNGDTAVYDAVDFTLNTAFRGIDGRKAIVIFSDGMDMASETATLKGTLRDAEEAEVLIYSIQYDALSLGGKSRRQTTLPPVLNAPGLPAPMPIPQSRRTPQKFPPGGSIPGKIPDMDSVQGKEYLDDLAEKTGGRLYRAEKIKDISESFKLIAEELRQQYSLGYYPIPPEQEEARKIKVRVNQKKMAIRARESIILRPARKGGKKG